MLATRLTIRSSTFRQTLVGLVYFEENLDVLPWTCNLVENSRDVFLTPKTGNAKCIFCANRMDTILMHISRTGIYRFSPTNDSAALDELNPPIFLSLIADIQFILEKNTRVTTTRMLLNINKLQVTCTAN